jgi:hypothetical protein
LLAAPEAEFETCDNQAHVLSPPSEIKSLDSFCFSPSVTQFVVSSSSVHDL